ncbi:MAG: YceI family protein [Terracidiphilus sp.]
MKLLTIATGILALAAPLAMAQAQAETSTWISDPAHSEVDFSVTHLSITSVHGRFGKVAATLLYDQTDVSKSAVAATIDISTVDTSEDARNNHLKTPDFFDLAKFPTATFASTSVTKGSSGLIVNGNLTLHGVTKPVVLYVEGPNGPVQGMDKKQHAGFSATTTISRSDFGIGAKFPGSMVGDEIKLSIDLDVAKQ